jgi:heat shock protein HslJ
MKGILGFAFFLLFLAGITLVMMQGKEMARQNMPGGGVGMTGVTWRPTIVGAEELPADSGMFVQFAVDGSINGNGGCNSFFGSLQKANDGIVVGELGTSRMACPEKIMDREVAFMQALQNAVVFETGSDRLQLVDNAGVMLADLVKED